MSLKHTCFAMTLLPRRDSFRLGPKRSLTGCCAVFVQGCCAPTLQHTAGLPVTASAAISLHSLSVQQSHTILHVQETFEAPHLRLRLLLQRI